MEAMCLLYLTRLLSGHGLAWRAGVLHKDISIGNVLISEIPAEGMHGFLHDFDYSSMTSTLPEGCSDDEWSLGTLIRVAEDGEGETERTVSIFILIPCAANGHHILQGTYYYWAIDLLLKENVVHTAYHDLEAFYWVFLWSILRWTEHNWDCATYQDPCDDVFSYGNDRLAAALKFHWLWSNNRKIVITGNAPLTEIAYRFKELLFKYRIAHLLDIAKEISHEAVLKIFDDALKPDVMWPENDRAIHREYKEPQVNLWGDGCLATDSEGLETEECPEPRRKKRRISAKADSANGGTSGSNTQRGPGSKAGSRGSCGAGSKGRGSQSGAGNSKGRGSRGGKL